MSSQLPVELWLQIASYLSRPWLSRLARSNRTFYSTLFHTLHHHLLFQRDVHFDGEIRQTVARISADPELSRAVRSCTLRKLKSSTLDFVILSFRLFPNLADITLESTRINENQLDQLLISIDKHPFSLTLFRVQIDPSNPREVGTPLVYNTHGPLPCFTSLSIDHSIVSFDFSPLFIHWTSTHTLEHLSFCGFIEPFLSGRLKQVPFPKLKTLRLSSFLNKDVELFELMPMLEGLYIHGTIYSYPLVIPKQSLPRLCHFEGKPEYVMPFVRGRPVHSVALSRRVYMDEGLDHDLNFGSLTLIRRLTLNDMSDASTALKFAVSVCPALHELTISQNTRYPTAPVCDSPSARPKTATNALTFCPRQPKFVRDHVEDLRRLTELRKLVYTSLKYGKSWTTFSWERRVGEAWEQTAPAIRTVRPSLKEWDKSGIDNSCYYPLLKTVVDRRTPELVASPRWSL